jgi:hypothetical protein
LKIASKLRKAEIIKEIIEHEIKKKEENKEDKEEKKEEIGEEKPSSLLKKEEKKEEIKEEKKEEKEEQKESEDSDQELSQESDEEPSIISLYEMTVPQLKSKAKDLDYSFSSTAKKGDLISLIVNKGVKISDRKNIFLLSKLELQNLADVRNIKYTTKTKVSELANAIHSSEK